MHIYKKRLHLYELPLQYHLQKRKESYELPAKSENQMQQEFLLPGSDDQGYFHGLYKCPAISGVFYQKKGHPILPDFVLTDQKQLYVERTVNDTPRLQPVTAKTVLQVGDKVVSRLSIRVDRAMDFVQLKDQRGACFEPIGSISGYRWNNGLGYYVDIKDASTNFFFDHLGKGVYVLEYSYRVSRAGTYETGLATMQCAYAPEYASHSASMTIIIK